MVMKEGVNVMTKFVASQFVKSGDHVMYDDKFVARFKHQTGDRSYFLKFLRQNFTVEEYFSMLDSGMAPAKVLETKGYVSKTVQKILLRNGFTPDQFGFDAYMNVWRAKVR